ncbi:MAG: tripartite tricarboxylate transporter substrate-binding protein [Defluviitaleaceae bacterium]|nr:tripartite tricarboxylate transporter substrate-binding protein [Defluviitaleaceae bacterium]MCL2273556.1 tripartite tricarboxylate transporter substrate-binding protein [Defluviitaleaceae bacterium]
MKKIIILCLALTIFILTLTACGRRNNEDEPMPTTALPAPANVTPTPTPDPVMPPVYMTPQDFLAGLWQPSRTISIVTHVASGGGMDVATRRFIEIAREFTDATIIVENITGGATRLASAEVLSRPADGYTIFGAAMSNVNNAITHGWDIATYIDGYYWIAKIQRDPAAVIITTEARDAGMDFAGILDQARAMGGSQIWAVPMLGGNKHFEALLTWQATGADGTAVPFESGSLGAAAVLGGAAHVQMGNPFDTVGRDLWVAAIAGPERVAGFEDSPTFAELGFPQLNDMHMWRGYAVRRGTPPAMIEWFQQLVYLVSTHPDWIEYNASNAIIPTAVFTREFRAIIQDTMDTTEYWLRHLGMLH